MRSKHLTLEGRLRGLMRGVRIVCTGTYGCPAASDKQNTVDVSLVGPFKCCCIWYVCGCGVVAVLLCIPQPTHVCACLDTLA